MSRVAGAYGQNRVPETKTEPQGLSGPVGIYIGVVKRNDDPQFMGRLQVYIEEFGGKPDDPTNWISVSYASPFAGTTSIFEQGSNVEEYEDTMKSYGLWAMPPDIDNKVLVAFANGRLNLGYWFACLFSRNTQISIPGIPAKKTHKGDNRPAAPKNKKDRDMDLEKYVQHTPMWDALKVQGLDQDATRGITSSSAMRETPSKVIGILTPGQHQFVMDDGDKDGKNRLIRLRTVNGVQVLMDDVSGHIYMITKAGKSWIEISNDGQIHLYGDNDINVRSEANVNIRADKDINLEAGRRVNIKAKTENINLETAANLETLAFGDTKITSGSTSNINSTIAHYETAGVIHMNGPVAATAAPIDEYLLIVNQGILKSICNVVPEHEPWYGHAGSINPLGPGNQQMKEDPAPDQTPRQPADGEMGAPLSTEQNDSPEVPLKELKASDEIIAVIKEENGFTPVNVEDGDGESIGFGSTFVNDNTVSEGSSGPNQDLTTAGIGEEAVQSTFLSDTELSSGGLFDSVDSNETVKNAATSQFNTNLADISAQPTQGKNKNLLTQINNVSNLTGQTVNPAGELGKGSVSEANSFVNKLSQSAGLAKAKGGLPTLSSGQLNDTGLGGISQKLAQGLGIGAATSALKSKLPNTVPGQNSIPNNVSSVLSQGVDTDRANQMLHTDITKSERAVKQMLAGVDKVPQSTFDSLVSFHNQTGDASYAFVNGEKIDLTQMYKNGEWNRAASFIAADERDRTRRIREAGIMSSNNYGNPAKDRTIVDQGLMKTNELIGKGKLNQQSGNPASWQQTLAAGASYFKQQGMMMPSLNLASQLDILDNSKNKTALTALKKQSGPWPY